jgi:hypothetical protein
LKKNYFSSDKLPKQQSTSFWSQGILGVKIKTALVLVTLNKKQYFASFSYILETVIIMATCLHWSMKACMLE